MAPARAPHFRPDVPLSDGSPGPRGGPCGHAWPVRALQLLLLFLTGPDPSYGLLCLPGECPISFWKLNSRHCGLTRLQAEPPSGSPQGPVETLGFLGVPWVGGSMAVGLWQLPVISVLLASPRSLEGRM